MESESYWESLAKRSLCRFYLLAELARAPLHGYRMGRAIGEASGGCCQPTEAMVYSALKELVAGGYVECREESRGGRLRRVCRLTPSGLRAVQAAGRVWQRVLPGLQETIAWSLGPDDPGHAREARLQERRVAT